MYQQYILNLPKVIPTSLYTLLYIVIIYIYSFENIYTHICTLLISKPKSLIQTLGICRNHILVVLPKVVPIYLNKFLCTIIIYDCIIATYLYTVLYVANSNLKRSIKSFVIGK